MEGVDCLLQCVDTLFHLDDDAPLEIGKRRETFLSILFGLDLRRFPLLMVFFGFAFQAHITIRTSFMGLLV